jgi:hypothetical protein
MRQIEHAWSPDRATRAHVFEALVLRTRLRVITMHHRPGCTEDQSRRNCSIKFHNEHKICYIRLYRRQGHFHADCGPQLSADR